MAARLERLFPSATFVCLASGPSLTSEDVDYCRGKAVVIAVNDTHRLAPWAPILYACDEKWWTYYEGVPSFTGLKFALQHRSASWPGVTVLKNAGATGLELESTGLRTGKNSGYQAINLAVHLGAARIVLLGYDMQIAADGRTHCFGDHPRPLRANSPYESFVAMFETLVEPLKAIGVEVINCTRETALQCFPRAALRDVLAGCEVAA